MVINISPANKQAYQLFHKGILILNRAEQQGIRIDLQTCENKQNLLLKKIAYSEKHFKKTAFYRDWETSLKGQQPNIYSGKQLADFLYKVKHIKPLNSTASGQGSTDEEALELLDIPELSMLLSAKKLKKIHKTYLGGFLKEQVNGYIHPLFNLHLVVTYRGSSDSPNFQNIPKRDKEAQKICRSVLFPRPGHQLGEVDYKALEVCIAACYHQDPTMIKYIEDPSTDMHRDMAEQIFGIRYDGSNPAHKVLRAGAKNGFVFPQFYGDYYKNNAVNLAQWGKLPQTGWRINHGIDIGNGKTLGSLMLQSGLKSFNDFIEFIRVIEDHFWSKRFPVYAQWKDCWYNNYVKQGYFNTLTGFTCRGYMGRNQVINYPVQGSAFHCLLWSMIEIDNWIMKEKLDTRIIGQIHDALVFDYHPDEREYVMTKTKQIMTQNIREAWDWICVPLAVEFSLAPVDKSWADVVDIKF